MLNIGFIYLRTASVIQLEVAEIGESRGNRIIEKNDLGVIYFRYKQVKI